MAIRIFGVVWFCGVCLLVWVGFAGCSAIGMSQSAVDGAVGGRVVDSRGDSVVGARVTVKSTATEIAQTVVSAADGTFLVARVVPGPYEVVISAAGFEAATKTVTVELGGGGKRGCTAEGRAGDDDSLRGRGAGQHSGRKPGA